MNKHGVMEGVVKIHRYYLKNNETVQLLVVSVLRKLLDCNYTRDQLTAQSTKLAQMSFAIVHIYMTSLPLVDHAVRCLAQCARSEVCRAEIIAKNYIPYLVHISKRYCKHPSVLRSLLKLITWLADTTERVEYLYKSKAVLVALQCMIKHAGNRDVVCPALVYLGRVRCDLA
jgi:hypothetical protein